jgi:hypothetical protein
MNGRIVRCVAWSAIFWNTRDARSQMRLAMGQNNEACFVRALLRGWLLFRVLWHAPVERRLVKNISVLVYRFL